MGDRGWTWTPLSLFEAESLDYAQERAAALLPEVRKKRTATA
jgi:hypothetical protein